MASIRKFFRPSHSKGLPVAHSPYNILYVASVGWSIASISNLGEHIYLGDSCLGKYAALVVYIGYGPPYHTIYITVRVRHTAYHTHTHACTHTHTCTYPYTLMPHLHTLSPPPHTLVLSCTYSLTCHTAQLIHMHSMRTYLLSCRMALTQMPLSSYTV